VDDHGGDEDGSITIQRSNTILYCDRWSDCVDFYRRIIGLAASFENEWFVEFEISESAMLSVADARRATIGSAGGSGITLTWRVASVEAARARLERLGVAVTPLSTRWGSTVCYCHDPEGHRIELWESIS
jgi:catechol 2,3-dioxygenase-like lactoylglutathione lyase family enzyme